MWQKAHQLALAVYRLTANFPEQETFGLTCQLQRAAASVPAHIAEGFKRRRKPDQARLLNIAQGFLEECRYYLILAEDLGYGNAENQTIVLKQVSRFLHATPKRIQESENSRSRRREEGQLLLLYGVAHEPARTFKDLLVWQKAHQLVLAVYHLTADFPKQETFGLTCQLQRAAVSVPANIAEGFKRRGKPDKARLLNIAQGSLEECRYYLILAEDLGYCNTEDQTIVLEEVSRFLEAYIQRIVASSASSTS